MGDATRATSGLALILRIKERSLAMLHNQAQPYFIAATFNAPIASKSGPWLLARSVSESAFSPPHPQGSRT
jgi:hypothetical protein